MAKFCVCESNEGVVFDCVPTLGEARDVVAGQGGGYITSVEVPINYETIQRLLGQSGGYAMKTTQYNIGADGKMVKV